MLFKTITSPVDGTLRVLSNRLTGSISLARYKGLGEGEKKPNTLFTNHQGSRSAALIRTLVQDLIEKLPDRAKKINDFFHQNFDIVGINLKPPASEQQSKYYAVNVRSDKKIPAIKMNDGITLTSVKSILEHLAIQLKSLLPDQQEIVDKVFNLSDPTQKGLVATITETHDKTNWPAFAPTAKDASQNAETLKIWQSFAQRINALTAAEEKAIEGTGVAWFIAITTSGLNRVFKDIPKHNPSLISDLKDDTDIQKLMGRWLPLLDTPMGIAGSMKACTHIE